MLQARRLSLEWQAYIGRTHALRKVFASVKGFYFQAEVLGQMVTWLVPHQLAQVWSPCFPGPSRAQWSCFAMSWLTWLAPLASGLLDLPRTPSQELALHPSISPTPSSPLTCVEVQHFFPRGVCLC